MSRFRSSNRSKGYERAVKALHQLVEAEGSDVARSAYAEVMSNILRKEWAVSRNLSESKGHKCVPKILGNRCTAEWEDEMPCFPPAEDHASTWLREGKPIARISQPYALHLGALPEVWTHLKNKRVVTSQ